MTLERKIMTRRQALLAGFSKYYTGKPCINGHDAERYAQSGACQHCIHPPKSVERKTADAQATKDRRELLVQQSLEFNYVVVFCPVAMIAEVRQFAISLAAMMAPGIADSFIYPEQVPKRARGAGGDYRFRIHVTLMEVFRSHVISLVNARSTALSAPPVARRARAGDTRPPLHAEVEYEPAFSADVAAEAARQVEAEMEAARRYAPPPP